MPEKDIPDDHPLARILAGLSEVVERIGKHAEHAHEMRENQEHALDYARTSGGIVVPMGVDVDQIPEHYRELAHGLMVEQGRASLFLGQLDPEHPYRVMFGVLAEAMDGAAMMGALQIAKHNKEHHGAPEIQVGPEEFGAAWGSLAMSICLAGVRYGQSHPDAFKGLEGLEPGEIDTAVADLIAWAAAEHGKGGEAAPEEA